MIDVPKVSRRSSPSVTHPPTTPLGSGPVRAMVAVGALGGLLRAVLALVNREANDDHLSVIRVIAREGRIPRANELFEGFQPKLYHETTAVIWRIGPWSSDTSMLLTAQMVSCLAGILTLVVVGCFLHRLGFSARVSLLAFSLVALNPKLVGLSAQATNDSFVMLFSSLALFYGWLFLRSGRGWNFSVMAASCALAALSKGNALVTFVTLAVALAIAIGRGVRRAEPSRTKVAVWTATFIVGFVGLFASVGPYRANYDDSGGRLFTINVPRDPLPSLVDDTHVGRPGTTSIVSTYLTFRFIDLMRHPAITEDPDPTVYPVNRTSLWSQLYGRANSLHFDRHPPSWADTRATTSAVTRSILVLALLPGAILLMGLFHAGTVVLRAVKGPGAVAGDVLGAALMVGTFMAYVAFIVVFTLRYRDFASMKVEYMTPGVLSAVFLFCVGADRLFERYRRLPAVRRAVEGAIVALCGFYVLDVVILVARLV